MAKTKAHGYTATMMQDALCNELEQLFAGKSFTGQKGRKALKVFKQNLPIDNGVDDDTDTNAAASPYIVVLMEGGKITDPDSPQVVNVTLTICCYDEGNDREGYRDVENIKEDVVQWLCRCPHFGDAFTVLLGHEHHIEWAEQMDDTWPYYFGALSFDVTIPAMVPEEVYDELC